MVIYKALHGAREIWARPLSMRNEIVKADGTDGVAVNRFAYISSDKQPGV